MNELQESLPNEAFYNAWLRHNKDYKRMALDIRNNKFRIPRLSAYAGWRLGDEQLKSDSWNVLLNHLPLSNKPTLWTNDCATWTLDAIFLKEVIR